MKFIRLSIIFVLFICLSMLPFALAHAPLGTEDNESLETATIIPDPAKSWALYPNLHGSREAQYYGFSIEKGERILVMLTKPTDPEYENFSPRLALMGPELDDKGNAPFYVEVPEEDGVWIADEISYTEAAYEGFTPSSFYELAKIDIEAPATGMYYIVVYESSRGGNYGVVMGYLETFTLDEWLLIPLNLISIYQWEGQDLALILAPMMATIIIGLVLLLRQSVTRKKILKPFNFVGSLAGLFFMGTGFTVLYQIAYTLIYAPLTPEVIISLVFAVIPIAIGLGTLRTVLRTVGRVIVRTRIYMIIFGVLALFAWAGLLVGPVLAIISSVLPSKE